MRLEYKKIIPWLGALFILAGCSNSEGAEQPAASSTTADSDLGSSSAGPAGTTDASSDRALGMSAGSAGAGSVASAPVADSASSAPGPMGSSSVSAAAVAAGGSAAVPSAIESFADESAGASDSDAAEGASAEAPPVDDIAEEPAPAAQAGSLTAGVWDDNRNFEHFSTYRSNLLQGELVDALPFSNREHADAHERFSMDPEAKTTLDISLMIDTTGSMGDEIHYLQTEFRALANTISKRYPASEQRWSMVVYRDQGDAYVTEAFAFSEDVEAFRGELDKQSAEGGGDTPEAPDAAFEEVNKLSWRQDDDTARLVFWVADAPHHQENADALAEGIRGAIAQDVHIYPIASSGIDELTEFTMRSAAQLSGGRYIFLTDDSGLGNSHKEPTIPCYFVTRLDQAILRMVSIELSGEYEEPEAADIIRTGGDPEDGACTLASGDQVQPY